MAAKPCPFCAIIDGSAPAHRVWEGDATLAFLDRTPVFPGHVLLIPRAHVASIYEADAATVTSMAIASKRLAVAVTTAMAAGGVFIAQNNIVSQSVPHMHTHIIPRRQGDGLFSPRVIWKRTRYRAGEAEEIAGRIRAAAEAM
jgi:histidine triad (HIT) family protein